MRECLSSPPASKRRKRSRWWSRKEQEKGGPAGVNGCNRGTSVEVGQGVSMMTGGLTEETRSQRSEGNLHDVKGRRAGGASRLCDKTGCREPSSRRSGDTGGADKLCGVPAIGRPLHLLLRTVSNNYVTG